MKNLYISELLLVSPKEQKARRIEFDRRRTLIYGKNHTGKSSIIKSIYKTFGAEPIVARRFEEAEVISSVKFEFDNEKYQLIRDRKKFALYMNDDLVEIFNSVTSELGIFLSNLFDFRPLFQSKSGGYIIPPPAYLLLPYYVDQDQSWTQSWAAFKNLQQIRDYRNQCINYHSGIRPNSYYETKKEISEYLTAIEEIDKEKRVTAKVLEDVKEKLSQTQFNIDIDEFKEEITALLTELEKLKLKEERLKDQLHGLYHMKASYDVQINIIEQAILESHKDLKFATEELPSVVGCPTCGAEYDNSFAERFEIAQDEQKSKDLLLEVKREAAEVVVKIERENEKLSNTTIEVKKIDELLESKKGELKFKDVIESSGKNQIKTIFTERYNELQKSIVENTLKKEGLEKTLRDLESKKRREEIVTQYKAKLTSFFKKLDIHSLGSEAYKSITTKIESLETGSARPRALIAYYFAFFHLMKKYSTTTYFPLIVDSPNQQDQDVEHIDKIMKFIHENQPEDSQMILGVAETYGVDFECKIINLTEPYKMLQADEYESVYSELKDKIFEMWK